MTPHVISSTFVELIYYFSQSRILENPEQMTRVSVRLAIVFLGPCASVRINPVESCFCCTLYGFLILKIYIRLASCF